MLIAEEANCPSIGALPASRPKHYKTVLPRFSWPEIHRHRHFNNNMQTNDYLVWTGKSCFSRTLAAELLVLDSPTRRCARAHRLHFLHSRWRHDSDYLFGMNILKNLKQHNTLKFRYKVTSSIEKGYLETTPFTTPRGGDPPHVSTDGMVK